MKSGSDILLVTKEEATANSIKTALNKDRRINLTGTCKEVSELRSYLSNKKVRTVIVDIDPDPSQILYDLGTILITYPETYVVVICSSFTKELVLQAMQAGARHFLEKKDIALKLSEELQQLIQDGAKKEAGLGSVISILSAGGGCGATTVAINLANELQLMSSKSVLTIDLDSCYGTVSTYLGIKSQYGIADVLAHKGIIDRHLIQSSAYRYKEDFHVLVSPAGIETPETRQLQYENLPGALEACRQVYTYTVIDASRIPESIVTNLAKISDVILIVLQLTIKDVNFARSIVKFLTKSEIAGDKIIPLANRFKKRGPLVRLEDSKKAVGLNFCQAIRNDWRKAMKSVNHGQPLSEVARRSALRSDFKKLAAKVMTFRTKSRAKSQGD